MAIIPRGVVQKIVIEPEPATLYLKHNPALFVEDEWVWTSCKRDGFIFDTFEKAEDARDLLKGNGEEGFVIAVVHQEIRIPEPAAEEVIRSMPGRKHMKPEEVFEQLEKRGLA